MDGRLQQVDGRWQLQFTRTLPHPPERVWRALTEPAHLAAWFPTEIMGERATGAALRFVFPKDEGPAFDGEMITYDPPSVLEYQWGEDRLRFELRPDDGRTVLTFTDTFDEVGRAARDAAGWRGCLDVLGYHLAGQAAPLSPPERWEEVHAGYVERFGPEASTIGPPEPLANTDDR